MKRAALSLLWILLVAPLARAADEPSRLEAVLVRETVGSKLPQQEVEDYCATHVPPLPAPDKPDEWLAHAERVRQQVLEKVVYRGEAAKWRDASCKVEWQETIDGGPDYRIKKLRYEALPGFWIPALLYEPEKLSGKMPVAMNVNGHDRAGKAAGYKQERSINLAKRGMLVLNVEWLGMGQLAIPANAHTRLNQIDLCGASGLAPFYLSMKRGLDVLLALPNADPERVAVSGLSGGGWQTIIISSLDNRVTLSNPVAGYSSFVTRARNYADLGDSEQTPVDLGVNADYAMLTAMRAPRPTLLTFNAKDQCCFRADHALPPLMDAATPVFKLFGKENALRSHVNEVPGTHNFEQDNREAFYRIVGDFFYAGQDFNAKEIPSKDEIKTADQLNVEIPDNNLSLHQIALNLAAQLPRNAELASDKAAAAAQQKELRSKLAEILRAKKLSLAAQEASEDKLGDRQVTYWRLKIDESWTVPAVEISPADAKGTVVVIADEGRKKAASAIEKHLAAGNRVVAVDPFYFGESKIENKDWLFALLLSTLGDRPLGLQAGQLGAVARWLQDKHKGPVTLAAVGPRTSVIALAAAGLEQQSISGLELTNPLGSLKEVLENDLTFEKNPELFCSGLLESFDIKQLACLAAPRRINVLGASERAQRELQSLADWYENHGGKFELQATSR